MQDEQADASRGVRGGGALRHPERLGKKADDAPLRLAPIDTIAWEMDKAYVPYCNRNASPLNPSLAYLLLSRSRSSLLANWSPAWSSCSVIKFDTHDSSL